LKKQEAILDGLGNILNNMDLLTTIKRKIGLIPEGWEELEDILEEKLWMPSRKIYGAGLPFLEPTIRKKLESAWRFITPESDEEALQYGFIPLKTKEGETMYIDLTFGAGPMKIIGQRGINIATRLLKKDLPKATRRVVTETLEKLNTPGLRKEAVELIERDLGRMERRLIQGNILKRRALTAKEIIEMEKATKIRELRRMGREVIPERPLPIVTDYIPASPQLKGAFTKMTRIKKLRPSQVKRLAREFLPTSKGSLKYAQEAELKEFLQALKGIVPKFGDRPPTIPRLKSIVPAELAEREFSRIGLLDIFKTPERVFRNIGVEKEGDSIFRAFSNSRKWLTNKRIDIIEWQMEIGASQFKRIFHPEKFRQQSQRIFQAINNPEKRIIYSAEKRIPLPTKDTIYLRPEEHKVIQKIKRLTDETADIVDKTRKELDLKPMNRRQNYITNLITEQGRLYLRQTKTPPNELFALLQRRMPTKIFNRFLLERKGRLPIREDVWGALNAMLSVHGKYSFLSPPIYRFERMLRFFGDKVPAISRWYITGRLNRFLGRPGMVQQFLRGLDEGLSQATMKLPFMKKQISVEMTNGVIEILDIPRFMPRLAQEGFNTLRTLAYMSDLAFSLPFWVLNATQFWQNVPPMLKGPILGIYKDCMKGYGKMLLDFFRPSKWKYWQRKGLLTEVDTLISNEFGMRGWGADIFNIVAKVSEFNNRVASAYATEANLARLRKMGRLDLLVPELNARFGGEAREFAINISDLTQFRYGAETKPLIFDNPILSLFDQYNTFARKQAELVADMFKDTRLTKLLPDFREAIKTGRTTEFFVQLTQGDRKRFVHYVINCGALIYILSLMGGDYFDAIGKSVSPTFLDGTEDILKGIWEGNTRQINKGLLRLATPPAIERLIRLRPEQLIPGRHIPETFEMFQASLGEDLYEVTQTKGAMETLVERITPTEARKRMIFGKYRTAQAQQNWQAWQALNDLQQEYNEYRDEDLISLLLEGKEFEARVMAQSWNKKMEDKISEIEKKYDLPFKVNRNRLTVQDSDIDRWIAQTIPTRQRIPAMERRYGELQRRGGIRGGKARF